MEKIKMILIILIVVCIMNILPYFFVKFIISINGGFVEYSYDGKKIYK